MAVWAAVKSARHPYYRLERKAKQTSEPEEAKPEFFDDSPDPVIKRDHPLDKANIDGGWKEPPAISSLRGQVKGCGR
jgi:hypothetical protein